MRRSPVHPAVFVCCATLCGVLGTMENLSYAASAGANAEVKPPPPLVATRHSAKPLATRKSHISAPRKGMASKFKKPSDRQARKALRGHKPLPAETATEPRPGLAHHGLLKAPHRYRPNERDGRSAMVTPHPGDLVQDHFLELDKNQDGVIDPVERAVGRLDIEWDRNIR